MQLEKKTPNKHDLLQCLLPDFPLSYFCDIQIKEKWLTMFVY